MERSHGAAYSGWHRQWPESPVWLNPPGYHLWDFAGVDGRQVARDLLGETALQIAPFQSAQVGLDEHTGAGLRLCEANFRVALHHDLDLALVVGRLGLKVWVKHSYGPPEAPSTLAVVLLPDALGQDLLPRIATTKPLYSLANLPLNQAVPARLNDLGILVWRHCWLGYPRYELQVAAHQGEALRQALIRQL